MQTFFTTLSIFLVLIVFISEWYNSKGNLRVVYPLESVKFFGFLVLETALALNHPEQKAILLFNLANIWGLFMNLKGMKRLIDNKKKNDQ